MKEYFRKLSSSRKQDIAVCLIGLVLMMMAMMIH
jgi:hypothetical protein